MSVLVNGKLLSEAKITNPETSFSRIFVLPPDLLGRESVEVTITVNKTVGNPPLGLAFGVFEIR